MKLLWMLLLAVSLSGCSSSRVSRYDEFEKMKVDKMRRNAVSSTIFARTLVCLNAARESRGCVAGTNAIVSLTTNLVVTSMTNQTVTSSSNRQFASLTNAVAAPSPSAESNAAPAMASSPGNSSASGVTTATTQNESLATAPNQLVRSGSIQVVTTLNTQATTGKDLLSITSGTNEVITVETNYIVTTITNQVVTPVTNVVVKTSEHPVADYYLYTEIAPADFPLAPGESLIVLADGVRYGCASATPQTAWESRRGYLTTYYKVAPDVILAIANAQEVKLRIKGTTGTLERKMSRGSRANFREFLLRNFGPAQQAGEPKPGNS